MTARLTERFDLLRAGIGLFVVLGIALTAIAGYALLITTNVTISTDLAVSALSGGSLFVFAVLLTTWLDRMHGPTRRRSV